MAAVNIHNEINSETTLKTYSHIQAHCRQDNSSKTAKRKKKSNAKINPSRIYLQYETAHKITNRLAETTAAQKKRQQRIKTKKRMIINFKRVSVSNVDMYLFISVRCMHAFQFFRFFHLFRYNNCLSYGKIVFLCFNSRDNKPVKPMKYTNLAEERKKGK